jgi:hypothetical protein
VCFESWHLHLLEALLPYAQHRMLYDLSTILLCLRYFPCNACQVQLPISIMYTSLTWPLWHAVALALSYHQLMPQHCQICYLPSFSAYVPMNMFLSYLAIAGLQPAP